MSKKLKIPKRIAGLKIPKAVRKGALGKFLKSSGGQLLLAQGVMLIGATLASKRVDPDSPAGKLLNPPHEPADPGDATDRLSRAFREGMIAFRAALLKGPPEGDFEAASKKRPATAGRTSNPPH